MQFFQSEVVFITTPPLEQISTQFCLRGGGGCTQPTSKDIP